MKNLIILTLLSINFYLNAEKPNIILFLCDDMGLADAQVYHPESTIPTPNINALANSGILFWDGHSPASVCTPTRYSILSGCYPFRSKPYQGVLRSAYDAPIFNENRETLPQMLQRSGYKTAAFGKWHIGMNWTGKDTKSVAKAGVETSHFSTKDIDFNKEILFGPNQLGFDYFFGLGSSINHGPYTFIENNKVTDIPTKFRQELKQKEWGGPFREGWLADSWIDSNQGITSATKALEFIEKNAKERTSPFFIYFSAPGNHWPYVPPKSFKGQAIKGRGGDSGPYPYRNDMIVENDVIVGEMIKRLKDPNNDGSSIDSIYENTLFIFTSDNGADKGYHPNFRGKKGDLYEGGHRVPFIVSWPKRIKHRKTSHALVSGMDLYASLASLTQTKIKPGSAVDSQDVLSAILGEDLAQGRKVPLYHEKTYTTKQGEFAIRQNQWKLLVKKNKHILYNLEHDLKESKDVAKDHPEIISDLLKKAQALRN